ncbi:hypothetical protein, partial [Bradyrhizobium elkanii]|uniref:hypothetical protein n=3 Tax=Bradyrhizobium elkanii TaxID=29448 RepID=UPI001AEC2CD1
RRSTSILFAARQMIHEPAAYPARGLPAEAESTLSQRIALLDEKKADDGERRTICSEAEKASRHLVDMVEPDRVRRMSWLSVSVC